MLSLKHNLKSFLQKAVPILMMTPGMVWGRSPAAGAPPLRAVVTAARTGHSAVFTPGSSRDHPWPPGERLATDSLEQTDLVELIVASRGRAVAFHPGQQQFQINDFDLSATKYIFIDSETGTKTISTITRSGQHTLRWNLYATINQIFVYNENTDAYDELGHTLDWDDVVQTAPDVFYGVVRGRLQKYDRATNTRTTLHTLAATAGHFQRIEVDASGQLFLYANKFFGISVSNLEMYSFDLSNNTITTILSETQNDFSNYRGIPGLATIDGKYYFAANIIKDPDRLSEDDKIQIFEIHLADQSYRLVYEKPLSDTADSSISSFTGFLNADGEVRFALQLRRWKKTLILQESTPPVIAQALLPQQLTEDFEAVEIDLSQLTNNPADTKSFQMESPGGMIFTAAMTAN